MNIFFNFVRLYMERNIPKVFLAEMLPTVAAMLS